MRAREKFMTSLTTNNVLSNEKLQSLGLDPLTTQKVLDELVSARRQTDASAFTTEASLVDLLTGAFEAHRSLPCPNGTFTIKALQPQLRTYTARDGSTQLTVDRLMIVENQLGQFNIPVGNWGRVRSSYSRGSKPLQLPFVVSNDPKLAMAGNGSAMEWLETMKPYTGATIVVTNHQEAIDTYSPTTGRPFSQVTVRQVDIVRMPGETADRTPSAYQI